MTPCAKRAITLLTTALCLPLVSACSTLRAVAIDPPQASLVQPCGPMPIINATATLGTLVAADVELAGQYMECAQKHSALAEWAIAVTKKK